MSIPRIYNLPDHQQNTGLNELPLSLKYDNGNPVDLTGASVKMQLKDGSRLGFEFSTEDGSLSILDGGIVRINKINKWTLPAAKYSYDLMVTDSTGFVHPYAKGTWNILPSVTK